MLGEPSRSGGPVGGAAGGRGEAGRVAARPGAVLGVVDAVSCGGGDGIGGDAELAVEGLGVRGRAIMLDSDAAPGVTDDLLPAAGDPGLDTDPRPDTGRQDRVTVSRVLHGEPFHAWHRDDAGGDAVCLELVAGIKRDLHFGPGPDQQDAGGAAVCLGEDVAAAGGTLGGSMAGAIAAVQDRDVLPAEDDAGGPAGVLDDRAPADAGLVRIAGPDHV